MSSRSRAIELSVLLLTGILIYLGSFDVPFIFDDLSVITMNPQTYNLRSSLAQLFSMRGLSTFTFALNYAWSGLELWSWHLVNLTIHLAATLLVYLLLGRLFAKERWLPLFGALIFLTHPLQTQAVTYIVQRMASLSALLALLCIYAFVRARERFVVAADLFSGRHLAWYAGSLAAGLGALLAKEQTVVLPALLLLTAWRMSTEPFSLKKELTYLAPVWGCMFLAALYFLLHHHPLGQSLERVELFTSIDPMRTERAAVIPAVRWKYFLTQFPVIWIYLKLLVFPWGQRLDYSYLLAQSFFELRVLAGLAGIILLTGNTLFSRNRTLIFALLWFFLCLAVESSLLPLEPAFEHRLYLPLFGYAVALCELCRCYLPERIRPRAGIALILILCILTVARNQLWRDPVRLWEDNLAKVPYSYRVKFVLAEALRKQGREPEAYALIEQVMRQELPRSIIDSELFWDKLISLGKAQLRFGRTAAAVATFRQAITYYPNDPPANFYLGTAYTALGNKAKARFYFDRARSLDPKNFWRLDYPPPGE